MILLTKAIRDKLLKNAKLQDTRDGGDDFDFLPVVKLFTPDAGCTWLFSEARVEGDDLILFGLCDVGLGTPELGYASFNEIKALRGKLGLPVERDMWFDAKLTLSEYADKAREEGGIFA